MQSVYETLLEVEMYHNFYKDKNGDFIELGADLGVIPTAQCQKHITNYGLLFRETPTGFLILYRAYEEDGSYHPLIPIEENLKLSFSLVPKKTNLLQYSDLPMDLSKPSIFYLNNLNNNQDMWKGSNRLLITNDTDKPYLSDEDVLGQRGTGFWVEFESSNPSAMITVKNIHDETVLTQKVFKVENKFRYFLDLKGREAGRYQLEIDGNLEESFYLEPRLSSKPFGVMEFFYHLDVPTDYQFIDGSGKIQKKKYTLRLKNRKTIWRYFVVLKNRTELDPKDLDISSSDFSATFHRRSKETLSDDSVAIPFDSGNKKIPLQYEPIKGIELNRKTTGMGGGGKESTKLPNPKVTNLKQENGKIYSEIMVYV